MKIEDNGSFYLLANKNGKWGLIDYNNGSVIVPFEYNSIEDVPVRDIPQE